MRKFFKIVLFTAIFGLWAQNAVAQNESKVVTDNRVAGTFSFSNVEYLATDVTSGEVKYFLVFAKKTDSTESTVTISSFACYASETQKRNMQSFTSGICYIEANQVFYTGTFFVEISKTEIPSLVSKINALKNKGKKETKKEKKQQAALEEKLAELNKSVILVITSWGDQLGADKKPVRTAQNNGTTTNYSNSTQTTSNEQPPVVVPQNQNPNPNNTVAPGIR